MLENQLYSPYSIIQSYDYPKPALSKIWFSEGLFGTFLNQIISKKIKIAGFLIFLL